MKLRIAGTLALFLVAGCARPGDELVWYKDGAREGELEAALYECERDTRMSAISFGYGEAQAFAARCMNAKGFGLVSASTLIPTSGVTYSGGTAYSVDAPVLCRNRAGQSEATVAGPCVNSGGTVISRR